MPTLTRNGQLKQRIFGSSSGVHCVLAAESALPRVSLLLDSNSRNLLTPRQVCGLSRCVSKAVVHFPSICTFVDAVRITYPCGEHDPRHRPIPAVFGKSDGLSSRGLISSCGGRRLCKPTNVSHSQLRRSTSLAVTLSWSTSANESGS